MSYRRQASAGSQDVVYVSGERGGELLPLLLKPGTLTKMSKAERAALRQRTGLDSFADMVGSPLLLTAPSFC